MGGARLSLLAMIPATLLAATPSSLEGIRPSKEIEGLVTWLRTLGAIVRWEGDRLSIDPRPVGRGPLGLGVWDGGTDYRMSVMIGRQYPFWDWTEVPTVDTGLLALRRYQEVLGVMRRRGSDLPRSIDDTVPPGRRVVHMDAGTLEGTVQLMLASVRMPGQTIIEWAARDPEVVDIATFLISMGAHIKGAGTDTIRVEGVSGLHGCRHTPIPDRFEASIYLLAAAVTAGSLWVDPVIVKHVSALLAKLQEAGVHVQEVDEGVKVSAPSMCQAVDLKPYPYPGLSPDVLPLFAPFLVRACGTSILTDVNSVTGSVYHFLGAVGANVRMEGRTAIIQGGNPLLGGGQWVVDEGSTAAAVLLAAMAIPGETNIRGGNVLTYCYPQIVSQFVRLGAQISIL